MLAKGECAMNGTPTLFLAVGTMVAVLFFIVYASQRHDLNGIKDRTVGHGQHGTARWATKQEVKGMIKTGTTSKDTISMDMTGKADLFFA